ncbi:hypothetical protein AaE_000587 [Aphanomyces astaci]|uniref:Peptidase M13 N-terminal domain-containing protein n=1 Tax=Aphanomyces astaci TaxID=112090 RepID=A0A6A5B0Y7_APHAT|nr:hypothetical protein AaE_000587 [Aphanomyces astaci]
MVKVLISLISLAATAGYETPRVCDQAHRFLRKPLRRLLPIRVWRVVQGCYDPPGRTHNTDPITMLSIQNQALLTKILPDNKPKLGEFYNSCLDTATLSSLGLTPLEDSLKAIRSANTTLDLLVVAGELAKSCIPAFVDINSSADDNNSTKNALFGFRTPLPLGRSYYTNHSKWETVEADYKVYIATVLQLARYTAEQAAAAVPVIIRFEQTLAGVALNKLEEMEAVVFTYTAFTYYELDQKYPLLIGTPTASTCTNNAAPTGWGFTA